MQRLISPVDLDSPSFRSAVSFALSRARLPGRKLTEEERDILVRAVATQFKDIGWTVAAHPMRLGPDVMAGPSAMVARGLKPEK